MTRHDVSASVTPAGSRARAVDRVERWVGPLVVGWTPFLAYRFLVEPVLYFRIPAGTWLWLLLIPALAVETWYTYRTDWPSRRRSLPGRVASAAGFVARIWTLAAYYYVLVVRTGEVRDTPDVYASLLDRWIVVIRLFAVASGWVAWALAMLLLLAYGLLTVRTRRFRFTTTVLLPLVASWACFYAYYHAPTHHEAPEGAELIFPVAGDPELGGVFTLPLYPRDLYVAPDDSFLVATFGGTFSRAGGIDAGDDMFDQPHLVWMDLPDGPVRFHRSDTIRRFTSECPDAIYVGPWHLAQLLELFPATDTLNTYTLPPKRHRFPVEECNFVYHACDTGLVYYSNSRNPLLYVWDPSTHEVVRTIDFAALGAAVFGDTVFILERDRARHRLYVGTYGSIDLIVLDDRTFEVVGRLALDHAGFDISLMPDGESFFVPAWFRSSMVEIDALDLRVIRTLDAPLHTRRVEPSPDGSTLYAAGYLTGELWVYDAASGEVLQRVDVGGKPEGMYVTDRYLYLSTAYGIIRFDRAQLAQGESPDGAAP